MNKFVVSLTKIFTVESLKKRTTRLSNTGNAVRPPQELQKSLVGRYVKAVSLQYTQPTLGANDNMKMYATANCIGKILDVNGNNYVIEFMWVSGVYEHYKFRKEDVVLLPESMGISGELTKEVAESQQRLKEHIEEMSSSFWNAVEEVVAPCTIPFYDINFCSFTANGSFYDNWLQTGISIDDTRFIKYKLYRGEKVIDLLRAEKENGDFLMYAPLQWAKVFGFNEETIGLWIDFVNGLGFETKIEYLGLSPLDSHNNYPDEHYNYKVYGVKVTASTLNKYVNVARIVTENNYLTFKLYGCECGAVNEAVYNVFNYFHRPIIYKVPGLCLQMRKELDASVSNSEIFFMSLIAISSYFAFRKFEVVDIFNSDCSIETILRKMIYKGYYFHDAFPKMQLSAEDYAVLSHYLKNKDFKNLYLTYKNLKNEKS